MAGIIGNYIIAYGFITDISNGRYFEKTTVKSDMEEVRIKKRWGRFLNEVGWYHSVFGVKPEEQSKLYVFGERILSVEDDTLVYLDSETHSDDFVIYDIEKDIFAANVKNRTLIDNEAALNNTAASFLLFMNDKDLVSLKLLGQT